MLLRIDAWELKVFVHGRLAELLLDLCLEDVQLILHVPVDVRKALL